MSTALRLDVLYRMTAFIYSDRNSTRPKESTFAHFIEVCGMLTVHDRGKRKEGFDLTDALCKALGWYFPLLAKMNVESAEQLIFRKYPRICPYCRRAPHVEKDCKQVRGTDATVNHTEVVAAHKEAWEKRPYGLNEWQTMFNDIYPRGISEGSRSLIALMEELGELAEAVRVFEIHPQYFLGEAADTFSYIMGIATEHQLRLERDGTTFSFEDEYLSRYPGLCLQCGSKVCVCPAIPSATVGRMAKELRIGNDESLFVTKLQEFQKAGANAGITALEEVGGYRGLINQLPFDRGDANHAIVHLCLSIAEAIENSNSELAGSLRADALKVSAAPKPAGSHFEPVELGSLLEKLRTQWHDLDKMQQAQIKAAGGLIENFGDLLDSKRVLFVLPNPTLPGRPPLKLDEEQRAIRQAIQQGRMRVKILAEELPAAQANDLRSALLKSKFDIIQFSGHADRHGLLFERENKQPDQISLEAVAQLVSSYPSVECVVLNACESVQNLSVAISPITIGMDQSIKDRAAIEFSRGFYDALGNGETYERAYEEGRNAVKLKGYDDTLIKMIKK